MHEAGSGIPWSDVIRFHMDIVGRGEESFFSFSPDDEASERWAYANESMMTDLAGPWFCKLDEGSRPPFWTGAERGTHESVFLGGPCYVASERRDSGRQVPVRRPLLYREVELTATEEGCAITPRQGKWAFCPPVWGLLDRAQVVLSDNEKAFLRELIDGAAQRAKDRDESLASAVLASLIDKLPELRESLPLATWRHVGPIDSSGGRERVSEVLESIVHWWHAKEEVRAAGKISEQVGDAFATLTGEAKHLGATPKSAVQGAGYLSPRAWDDLAKEAHARSREADAASGAWRRRADHKSALDSVRQWLGQWRMLGSAVHDILADGSEAPLAHALRRLESDPGTPALRQLGEAHGKCDVAGFLRAWRTARRHHTEATVLGRQRKAVPSVTARVNAWWDQVPETLVATFAGMSRDRWPEPEVLNERLAPLHRLLEETVRFLDEDRPGWKEGAEKERKWANEELRRAAELVPTSKPEGRALRERCMKATASNASWPIDALRDEFRQFGIETLIAGIESIDRKLAKRALQIAEAGWLERLLDDDEACRAVSRLETSLARSNGVLPPDQVTVFRHALRAAPIWITTAKSVQSVPTAPELFDVVLVDEASQCTLTDLLPALYRGRQWAVIGDGDQLPAIPTVHAAEEQALSHKYGLDPFLDRVGHSDLFTLCATALPRGRSDVLQLEEHFRSHPQIIGFSNRHIYQQRLQLAPDTLDRSPLPVASGLFPVPVAGYAERGDRGRSWINHAEAERVVDEVKRLATREGLNGAAIGIVTPFGGQKTLIQDLLAKAQISNDLKVDSAHGFQGDERDIMMFSPVVARGMTPGARRWVETPPNLTNVALTRARFALFVVADLDFLRHQSLPSLLHRLAVYCRDIATLRETSEAELLLFSWMMLQGWTPDVHTQIGDLEVDFTLSPSHREEVAPLAIEVDGEAYHQEDSATDRSRDAFLAARGFQVLRVSAREIFETPLTVVAEIERRLNHGRGTAHGSAQDSFGRSTE